MQRVKYLSTMTTSDAPVEIYLLEGLNSMLLLPSSVILKLELSAPINAFHQLT
jgi:hypothetical protein